MHTNNGPLSEKTQRPHHQEQPNNEKLRLFNTSLSDKTPRKNVPKVIIHTIKDNRSISEPNIFEGYNPSNFLATRTKENIPEERELIITENGHKEAGVESSMSRMFSNMSIGNYLDGKTNMSVSLESLPRILKVDSAPPLTIKIGLEAEKTRLQAEAQLIRTKTKLSPRKMKLEILTQTSQPELNCLSPQTVASLVLGMFNSLYEKIFIIDCRFEYEHNGGHIKGALSFPTEEELCHFLIKDRCLQDFGEKLCLVFHCEFSSHRGPKAYKKIRSLDRKQNECCYPHLFYPEMYILEGGYKQFWLDHPELCVPHGYVEMKDPSFVPELRRSMQSRGRSKSQRRFFSQSCSNIYLELNSSRMQDEKIEDNKENTEDFLTRTFSAHI